MNEKKSPKTAAIQAYNRDLLSKHATDRVREHIRESDGARRVAAADLLLTELAADIRDEATPELDWDKMDLALRREARAEAKKLADTTGEASSGTTADDTGRDSSAVPPVPVRRFPIAAVGSFVAAAAAVAFVVASRQPTPQPTTVADASAASLEGIVTSVSGTVTADGKTLALGSRVRPGAWLESGKGAEAHVQLTAGTGFVMHGESRVHVGADQKLTRDEMLFVLDRGSISNLVERRANPIDHRIRSGRYEVRVLGTHFRVVRNETRFAVSVTEGAVAVFEDGELLKTVTAPDSWSTDEAEPNARPKVVHLLAEHSGATRTLELPAVEGVTHWMIGDHRFPSADATTLLAVPAKTTQLVAMDGTQEQFRIDVAPGADKFIVTSPVQESRPVQAEGTLAPHLIAPVVKTGIGRMQRCRDFASRNHDEVIGKFRLRIRIAPSGRVAQAQLLGAQKTPPGFKSCILKQARSWQFPKPTGGPVTFEQPLQFRTKQ